MLCSVKVNFWTTVLSRFLFSLFAIPRLTCASIQTMTEWAASLLASDDDCDRRTQAPSCKNCLRFLFNFTKSVTTPLHSNKPLVAFWALPPTSTPLSFHELFRLIPSFLFLTYNWINNSGLSLSSLSTIGVWKIVSCMDNTSSSSSH